MNSNDLAQLAQLLKGANITINVQTGDRATQYNCVTQINRHAGRAARNDPVCGICGYTGGSDLYGHAFGVYYHQSCIAEEGRQARALRDEHERRKWEVIERRTNDEVIEADHQIAAPQPEPEQYILVRDDPAKYADRPAPFHIPLVKVKVSKGNESKP